MREFDDLLLDALDEQARQAQRCADGIQRARESITTHGDLQAACNEIATMRYALDHLAGSRDHLLEMLRGVGVVPV